MENKDITPAPANTDPELPPGFDPAKLVIADAQEAAKTAADTDPATPAADGPDNGKPAADEHKEPPRLAEPPADPKEGDAYTDNYGRKQVFADGEWEVTERPKYYVEDILDSDGNVLVQGGERSFEEIQEAQRSHQNYQNFIKINQQKATEMGQMIKSLKPLLDGLSPLAGDGLDEKGNVIADSKLEQVVNMVADLYGAPQAAKLVELMKFKPAEFEDPIKTERDQLVAEKQQRENREFVDGEFAKLATARKLDEATTKKVREHWLKLYKETGRATTPELAYLAWQDKYGKTQRPAPKETKPLPSAAGVAGVGGIAAKPPANIQEAMDNLSKFIDPQKLVKR